MDSSKQINFAEAEVDACCARPDTADSPGWAVGISFDGQTIYRKAFGLANVELPLALSPTVRLRVGSVTKQFTCLAYLSLCEHGHVSFDDTIGRFLPDLPPTIGATTIRQLMSHTSGIRDIYTIFDRFNDAYTGPGGAAQRVTSRDLIELYRRLETVEKPRGETWSYNNGGYLLLSEAIARIGGSTFSDVLRDHIFKPMGMNDTMILFREDELVPNRATEHVLRVEGGYIRMGWGMDCYSGAGAAISTVDDLLRWLNQVFNPTGAWWELSAPMRERQPLRNGLLSDYGLGVQIDTIAGHQAFFHSGNALGGNAHVVAIPDLRLAIAVVSNRQDAHSHLLTSKLLEQLLGGSKASLGAAPATLDAGVYQSAETGRTIALLNGRADNNFGLSASIDGFELPLSLAGADRYVVGPILGGSNQQIRRADSTDPSSAIIYWNLGTEERLDRVTEFFRSGATDICGRFFCREIATRLCICKDGGAWQMMAQGPFGSVAYKLAQLSSNAWRAEPSLPSHVSFIGGVILIDADGAGLRFSSYGMRNLHFERDEDS